MIYSTIPPLLVVILVGALMVREAVRDRSVLLFGAGIFICCAAARALVTLAS